MIQTCFEERCPDRCKVMIMNTKKPSTLYNNGLDYKPFPNKPWFLCVCSKSLLKTLWEKEKLLITSNFSFSHSVFYPFEEISAIFLKFKIVVCKLCEFGRVLNLSSGSELIKAL